MKKQVQYTFIFIILSCIITSAQDISFSGFGATGYIFYNRNILNDYNQETYYMGKLQADIEFNKNIEAQLDLRGNSTDNSVNFREFSAKFKYIDKLKFKIGNIKKPFGYEQLINREKLDAVSRSFIVEQISELGYGGRSVSLMVYYKYSKKKAEFPFSYYASVFKNNSLVTGFAGRFSYHLADYGFGINYMFQQQGGENKINTHGVGGDISINSKDYHGLVEVFYVQNPVEGLIRQLQGLDEAVFSGGAAIGSAYTFRTEAEIIKKIEPIILLSYFVRDIDITDNHVIQSLLGVNFYFQKDVRLRLNGDLRFTKNQFNKNYNTKESRVIIEVQVRF